MNFAEEARSMQEMLREFRRDIHMYPELPMKEFRTSGKIKNFLKENNIEILPLNLPTTVVAVIRGEESGKRIALKADMDALQIQEQTNAEYASRNEGVMHACGHDVHTACLIGAAAMLKRHQKELQGTVYLIFQAAEENLCGAKQIIETGFFSDEKIEEIFSLHTNTSIEAGKVAFMRGASQASADMMTIHIHGKGGHGAFPNTTVDPVYIASQLICQIQSIVSRNIDPIQTGVVSVCQMTAGTSGNIIPENAELSGTYRAMTPQVRELIRERLKSLCRGIEIGYGCECRAELPDGCPPIINDPVLADTAKKACGGVLGEENVLELSPAMVGDDMGFILEKVPGVLGALGVRNEKKGIVHGNHTPYFDVDEECLWIGAACMAQMAWDSLAK